MGLDTTHDCWHGSYSAFGRWRDRISTLGGYTLRARTDGGSFGPPMEVAIDWDRFERKNYDGEWDTAPDDPLLVLIVHSDCDGHIKPEHAGPLADRLQAIMDAMPPRGLHDDCKPATERFIAGLRRAAAANERVEFH